MVSFPKVIPPFADITGVEGEFLRTAGSNIVERDPPFQRMAGLNSGNDD
ncbi:uncharacterized protein G2W53_011127 [Senna tora]|uniref:Uncharacterized protein n=1 Tax=Senna tora TaxID=362788 RepID=A0A834X175_9FABA|nr:uncharacterized protein G2W53_011127 [Senna tora]